MQPYQNFQNPMTMPMQYQPMYGQPQMQTPYMDRLSQLQAMQQSMQPQPQPQQFTGLNGRIVESAEGIVASDVPMDGTFAIFPKRDMSEVYIKYWTGEGKIATVLFKPISDPHPNTCPPSDASFRFDELSTVLGGLYDKVDNLSTRIDEFLKTKGSSRSKKEVSTDE